MQRVPILFNLLIINILLLFSCSNDVQMNHEVNRLKNKIKKDSLNLLEMNKLISYTSYIFDSTNIEDKELQSFNNTSKMLALEKINQLSEVIKNEQTKIYKFENELNIEQSALPRVYLKALNSKLDKKIIYYTELLKEIETHKNETINLKKLISEKNENLKSNNNIISELEEINLAQKIKLEKLKKQILFAQNEMYEAKQTTAKTYYNLSNDLKELADKTSGILAKKKKKNLIKLAYQYYIKAYEFGFNKAKVNIELLENDKKYNKYLEN